MNYYQKLYALLHDSKNPETCLYAGSYDVFKSKWSLYLGCMVIGCDRRFFRSRKF
ncbi:hypothetical protein QUA40_01785 [Microcoleus sp. Pol11C3]|uniref:hypothetical protein n=1 Tax=Microcoleus sp. Pol11C3 TaxID=3055390 RepID=UPI002FD47F5E